MNEHPDSEFLTISDVVEILPTIGGQKVARQTVWRWMTRDPANGPVLKSQKIGRRIVTTIEHVREFLAECNTSSRSTEVDVSVRAGLARKTLKERYGF